MDRLRARRDLHRGFGDALSRAFEFAATTGIFLAIGFGLDRWLGTTPLLMIVLVVFALVGQFVKLWYAYDAEMRRLERDRELAGFTVAPMRSAARPEARRSPARRGRPAGGPA